ncbi:MAG: hypothetical protein WAK60_08920 [Sedimentisphaerales bacterium]
MFEIARYLEQMAVRFEPAILIGPGLAAVLLGLFVWLGGLGFRRTLVVIIGAVSGGICGFFMSARNIVPATVSAIIAAVAAIIFEKIFITITAGVLAGALGFAVLARPYIANGGEATPINRGEIQNKEEVFGNRQSAEVVKAYIADFVAEIKKILSEMPVYKHIIIAAVAVIFTAAGFFQWRLASAFCCAALGTILIFGGMILLLLYKGAAPISMICQNQSYYLGVFAAMTVLGTAEQLLLCRSIEEKPTRKRETNKDGKWPEKTPIFWRNR